jgi:hypothetical protein
VRNKIDFFEFTVESNLIRAMSLKPTWPGAVYAKHQIDGINWMLNQERYGFQVPGEDYVVRGGILGDEMGLGKTIQSIALIVNGNGLNTLIVTPKAVRQQWVAAASKCSFNLFTAENTWVRTGRRVLGAKSVYIAHYDKVVSSPSLFREVSFDRIVLDEAHRIRNTNTVTGASILKIKAPYKWALTATPIVNKLDDVNAYLKFIGFKLHGSGWSQKYKSWIPHVFLARTLDECEAPAGLTMPPEAIVDTRSLEFTNKEEEELYNGIYKGIESQWRSAQALKGREYQLQKFAILLRLRQISVNPQIYIKARQKEAFGWTGPQFNAPSRKFDEITNLMREAFEANEGHRWIIFCQFHDEMVLLEEYLKSFEFTGSVLQYHGGMNMRQRDEAIRASNNVSGNSKQDVFLIQLQAGGTGLNLQHYDRMIFISPWWTAALLDQARGRAVRIGQKNVVKIYWLKLSIEEEHVSIDEFMMEKADEKRELSKEFLSWSHGRFVEEVVA